MKAKRPTGRILNAKDCTCIATWNVQTLNPSGNIAETPREMSIKLANTIREMKRYNISILGICETHWTGSDELTSDGISIIYSGGKEHARGVGIMLNKEAYKALITWEPISDRIMTARFSSRFSKITIVQAYAPTNEGEDSSKDNFYDKLQETMNKIPNHDLVILMGDFNAQITSNRQGYEKTIGPHGIGRPTDNGERMLQFCLINDLKIMNTFFKHKKIHKTTWNAPNGITKNEIDFICISKRWASSVQDVRTKRGADIGSDHELVVGKMKLKLKKVQQTVEEKRQKYDISKFNIPAFQNEYALEISNRFDALQDFENHTIEDQWKLFKEAVNESTEKIIGKRRGRNKEQWISNEAWDLIDERKNMKHKMIQKDDDFDAKTEYRRLDKLVKKQTRIDRQAWLDLKTLEAQNAADKNDTRTVYKVLKELSNTPNSQLVPIKSKDGKSLNSEDEIKNRWVEHFSSVLNQPQPTETINVEEPSESLEIDTCPITEEEIVYAITKLKNNKAAGSDGIHPEMLKYGGPAMVNLLQTICNTVWENESIPEDWKIGTIITLPKKGDLSDCSNWRGITLLSLPSKVLCTVLLNRLKTQIDDILRDEQSGFRARRSCNDAIFALRNIIEKAVDFNIPVYLHFVDFQKAFDSIHRDTMWKIVRSYGVPDKILNVMKALYDENKCNIRVGQSTSKEFDIETGVKQGCILSPFLFIMVIDFILKGMEGKKYGIEVGEKNIFDLDFADDIALIDTSKEKLQRCTEELETRANQVGLRFNAKKCESMSTTDDPAEIKIGDTTVKQTEDFTYLGSKISNKGRSCSEIRCRIGKAGSAFGKITKIIKAKNVKLETKINIYNAIVLSILLYGCETWQIYVTDQKSLDAFHRRCLRKILGVTYLDRVTNVDVLERTQHKNVSDIIQERRLRWFGHVARMNECRFPKQTMDWQPRGKRKRGRPKLTWKETLSKDLKQIDITYEDAKATAQNRLEWKELTARCASSTGRTKV